MKNKIYVVVSVPMIEREFDMYIPMQKKIGSVKNLIIQIVEEQSDYHFLNGSCMYLYDKATGEKMSDHEFVRDSKIKNGSRLILF